MAIQKTVDPRSTNQTSSNGSPTRLHVALIHEEDAVSAIALNLPGVATFGDSEGEAVANIKEAAAGSIAAYEAAGQNIPWEDQEVPDDASTLWVTLEG